MLHLVFHISALHKPFYTDHFELYFFRVYAAARYTFQYIAAATATYTYSGGKDIMFIGHAKDIMFIGHAVAR